MHSKDSETNEAIRVEPRKGYDRSRTAELLKSIRKGVRKERRPNAAAVYHDVLRKAGASKTADRIRELHKILSKSAAHNRREHPEESKMSSLRRLVEDLRAALAAKYAAMPHMTSPPGPAKPETVLPPPSDTPGEPFGPPLARASQDPAYDRLITLLMRGLRDNLDLDKLGAEELRALRSFVRVVQLAASMTPEMAKEHIGAAYVPVVKQGLMHINIGLAIRDAVHDFLGEVPF